MIDISVYLLHETHYMPRDGLRDGPAIYSKINDINLLISNERWFFK